MHRLAVAVLSFTLYIVMIPPVSAQAQRDPQAVAIAKQAYQALGGSLPTDSRAVGNYDRVAGDSEDTGTIEILTRGAGQTSEKLTNSGGTTQVVYSRGYGSQKDVNGVSRFTLEKSLASNSAVFPMVVIATAVLNPNSSVQFVGLEWVNGKAVNHIRICPSSPDQNFTNIISLGTKDVWVDAGSGLPVQIAYQILDSEGSAPIPMALSYSNYQQVSGTMYPLQIQESRNGTPYLAISVSNVVLNVGLTDQDFPLQ
jgi:hypothetical protein